MDKELRLILDHFHANPAELPDGNNAFTGNYRDLEIMVAKCGIGKVNAALNTSRLIQYYKPNLVINTGVAGGAGNDIGIGETLIADSVCYHDVWCGPGTEYGEADGMPLFMKPSRKVLEITGNIFAADEIHYGLICTGDKFISTPEEITEIKTHFPEVKAVDMESAAIAHSCMKEGVEFNIIRVVSDTPGSGENIEQYKNFWSEAPEKTFLTLTRILDNLPV